MKKTKIVVHLEMYADEELSEKELGKLNRDLSSGADYLKQVVLQRTQGKAEGNVSVQMGIVEPKPQTEPIKGKADDVISALVDGLRKAGLNIEAIKVKTPTKEQGKDKDDCDCPVCTLKRLFEERLKATNKDYDADDELLKELDKSMTTIRRIGLVLSAFEPLKMDKDPTKVAQSIKDIEKHIESLRKANELLDKLPEEFKKGSGKYKGDKEYVTKAIQLAEVIITELKTLQPKAGGKPPEEATN